MAFFWTSNRERRREKNQQKCHSMPLFTTETHFNVFLELGQGDKACFYPQFKDLASQIVIDFGCD
jgi:hypothetical protein